MKKIISILILFLGSTLAFSQIQNGIKAPKEDVSRETYAPQADKPAEFPGGTTEFRNRVANKINTKKIKSSESKLSASAKFAINSNGNIESLSIFGNNETFNKEIEKAIKSVNTKWIPATYKSHPVKYWFQIPFTVYLD